MSGATSETIYTGTVLPVIFNPGKVFTDQSHRASFRKTAFGMSQQPFVFGSQMTVLTALMVFFPDQGSFPWAK